MFRKKSSKRGNSKKDQSRSIRISTIPEIFYGGKNPVIYANPVSEPKQKQIETKKQDQPPIEQPHHHITKKTIIIILLLLLFLIVVSVLLVFATNQTPTSVVQTPTDPPVTTQPVSPTPVETVRPIVPVPTTTTPVDPEPVETPSSTINQPKVLSNLPRIGGEVAVDFDADQLTDREEELFSTDSGTWDSDGDSYYDGQEVANLYNPTGFAPVRIIDSGIVSEYTHPQFGYQVYYPNSWSVGGVDDSGEEILFSSISGDYVIVHTFTLNSGETIEDWFARVAIGERYTNYLPHRNRFSVEGRKRLDDLVGLFVSGNRVFVLSYQPFTDGQLLYPHVMRMMIESFRPTRQAAELPDQPVVPTVTPVDAPVSTSSTTASST